MRLDLSGIRHTPGAALPFSFSLDLSQEQFYGETPVSQPVCVTGRVENHAGALVMTGEGKTCLSLTCHRCAQPFSREKTVPFSYLLADELAGEETEELVLMEDGTVDAGELAASAFILAMDSKVLCTPDCRGICPDCGADLNTESCRCQKKIDPRLAILGQLLQNPKSE